jgi:hypothetical protein
MTILAETANGIIGESDSYDIFLANYQAGGSDWTEMQSLCLDGVAQYALKWRSTLGDICDWQPMGLLGTTETILYQSLPRAPFWEQLRQNYSEKGVLGHFASDMQGNLHAFQDVNISGLSALLPQTALASGDTRDDIVINTVPRDANAQVSLHAVGNLNVPYIAESPAHVRGYFGGERVFEKGLLVDGQDRLITWTGNYRAKLNSKYPIVNVPLAGNTRIDPIPQSIVSLSLSGSENARGVSWVNKKFLPKDLNVTYDANAGYPLYDINMEELVNGIGGSSVNLPAIDEIVPIPTNPPPSTVIPVPSVPPTPIGMGTGFGTVYVLVNGSLYRTRNFSANPPTWTSVGPSVTGLNDFILDPWNPAQNGFLLGDDGVYRSNDLDTVSPTWDHVLTKAQIESLVTEINTSAGSLYKIVGSINVQGYFGFLGSWARLTINHSGGMFYCWTTDSGANWNKSIIVPDGTFVGTRARQSGALDVVPHVVGSSLVLYAAEMGNLHRSADAGASWSLVATTISLTGSTDGPMTVQCPYNNNSAGDVVYIAVSPANDTKWMYEYNHAAASLTAISRLSYTNAQVRNRAKRGSIETNTLNRQHVYRWENVNGSAYISSDGGSSWTEASMNGIAEPTGVVLAAGGFPTNTSQLYLVKRRTGSNSPRVFISTDSGENWTDKTGNLSSITASPDWRTVIVPLWTE